jgi:hypothetical protein
MSPADLSGIAERWIAAFNRHDLEGLLSLYHEDAEHYSPKLKLRQPATQGYIKGKPALRLWWQDAFDRLPTLHYRLLQLTPFENRILMEYVRQVQGEDNLQVGELLVIRDGLIASSRVYHS